MFGSLRELVACVFSELVNSLLQGDTPDRGNSGLNVASCVSLVLPHHEPRTDTGHTGARGLQCLISQGDSTLCVSLGPP